jgi:hypothetical protein
MGDGASPENFITIGEVKAAPPISVQKDLVEVTHMTSTAKEYLGGLSDGQRFSVTCNHIPNDAKQVALVAAAKTTSTAKNFRYVLPATAAGGSKYSGFAAVVMGFALKEASPNSAAEITFDLKISGAVGDWT